MGGHTAALPFTCSGCIFLSDSWPLSSSLFNFFVVVVIVLLCSRHLLPSSWCVAKTFCVCSAVGAAIWVLFDLVPSFGFIVFTVLRTSSPFRVCGDVGYQRSVELGASV